MAKTEKGVLKEEEKTLPSDADQSEDETSTTSEEDVSEDSTEDQKETEEEIVKISKSEFEKIKSDLENYRGAVKRLSKKERQLPSKKSSEDPEFVTREEFYRDNEKKAIAEYLAENSETRDRWDEIMAYFIAPNDRSVEGLKKAIRAADLLWRDANPEKPKAEEVDKKARADLVAERAASRGKGKKKKAPPKGRTLLKKGASPNQWY